jgi:hypothetical protein
MQFKTTLLLAFLAFSLTQCKKDSNDLTTDIVGKYTSGSGSNYREIIVTKVNDNTISVYIEDSYQSGQTHSTTSMNSKTSFTLNKVTETGSGTKYEYTGSGTYSANNIIITRNEKIFDSSNNNLISDDDVTYTGSK